MANTVVPLFCTTRLEETRAFYLEHLGFRAAVELDGYMELEQGEGGPRLAFMRPDGQRWQAASGQGLCYCFQVADADALHARLAAEGVTIVEEPTDKPWGERSFQAADPNGLTLYFGHALETARQPAVDSGAPAQ